MKARAQARLMAEYQKTLPPPVKEPALPDPALKYRAPYFDSYAAWGKWKKLAVELDEWFHMSCLYGGYNPPGRSWHKRMPGNKWVRWGRQLISKLKRVRGLKATSNHHLQPHFAAAINAIRREFQEEQDNIDAVATWQPWIGVSGKDSENRHGFILQNTLYYMPLDVRLSKFKNAKSREFKNPGSIVSTGFSK